MRWPFSILHLSDLHFGPHGRFAGQDMKELARRFHQAIEQARGELGWEEPVGLCIVTGDLAEAARPAEYAQALEFFKALTGAMGLARSRVLFTPGNHDVSWNLTRRVELEQNDEGFGEDELERRIQSVKFEHFEKRFLQPFQGCGEGGNPSRLPHVQSLGHGAFIHAFPEERLAVATLNSCERESHRRQGGFLSDTQAQALMDRWHTGEANGWLKIIAIHHNPVATVSENVRDWGEQLRAQAGAVGSEWFEHFAADLLGLEGREHLRAVAESCRVQLILHGHHHAHDIQSWPWRKKLRGNTLVLSSGSWGLQPGKLPSGLPNMMHLVRVDPAGGRVHSVLRVYEPRARPDGYVVPGQFVLDPVNPEGALLDLTLPPGFAREEEEPATSGAGKQQEFIQEYRTRLKRRYERWELSGIGAVQPGSAGKPIEASLDDMYLPLRLGRDFDIRKLDVGKVLEPEELLARKSPLVIRGGAGSGKTTWMRWTFRRLMELPEALPFMIELRKLARVWSETKAWGEERTLEAYLRQWVEESGAGGWKDALAGVLGAQEGPRPVLLVDGWDELGTLGEELREKLLGFLEAHPRVLAVVSSRPYGENRPSGSEGYEVLDLQPLSCEEMGVLTERFHRRVHGEDGTAARASARCFREALEGSPEAVALARSPLLLTMMLLISRDRPLPDKRHRLYEECIRGLLSARPEQREKEGVQLQREQWRPQDSEERLRAVAALAFRMQEEGYTKERAPIVGSWEELMALLPESWKREERSGFLSWLVGASGVMCEQTDGRLSFMHLSLQEYLAAHHLAASFEGNAQRLQLCRERMRDVNWWETLRLWAAIVGDRTPAHLAPVLSGLSRGEPAGYWLVGAILADGLAEESFEPWLQGLTSRFHTGEWSWAMMSARAWAASRQEPRRQAIAASLPRVMGELSWVAAIAARYWFGTARADVSPEEGEAFESLIRDACEGQGVGRAKVLAGSNPTWPVKPLELSLLRLVPTSRFMLSARLQVLLSVGASREEFFRAAHSILSVPREPERESLAWARELARSWASHWARDWARDWEGDLARYLARSGARRWAHDWARDWARGWARDWSRYWTRDLAREFARDWRRELAQDWARDLAQDWARDWARELAQLQTRSLAREWGLAEVPGWLEDFAMVEMASIGRSGTRVMIANSEGVSEPLYRLLQLACQASLNPQAETTALRLALAAYPQDGEPLWPALARHLARCSTARDRALLDELIRHPEKREPPLSWGLQYYVRGDLVLDEGEELTLDALCDQLGLPRLPYLEELPPELEVEEGTSGEAESSLAVPSFQRAGELPHFAARE